MNNPLLCFTICVAPRTQMVKQSSGLFMGSISTLIYTSELSCISSRSFTTQTMHNLLLKGLQSVLFFICNPVTYLLSILPKNWPFDSQPYFPDDLYSENFIRRRTMVQIGMSIFHGNEKQLATNQL